MSKVKIGKLKINVFLTGRGSFVTSSLQGISIVNPQDFSNRIWQLFITLKKNKTKSWHFYYDVETFFNNEVGRLF